MLIEVDELRTLLADRPDTTVVLDVRWTLGGPPGHRAYLAGHIPRAVYVDLDGELAAVGDPRDGRHPLPTAEALTASARRWGINPGDTVVAYDGGGNLAAARAWWLLRWGGHDDVRLLDGALPAWTAAGQPLDTTDEVPEPGIVTLDGGHLPVAGLDRVASGVDGVLLDARAPERFRGDTEPVDPKAGHIPGAVNAPTGDNLTPDGRFRPAEELRARFAGLGVDQDTPVTVYCGSGVTAAHQIAALAAAGIPATLYPGSWSQWSNHELPVATGDR